jgi:hypothetical protein
MSAAINNNSSMSLDYGYGEGDTDDDVHTTKKKTRKSSEGRFRGFRVSSLPATLRASVEEMNLDKNGTGDLELAHVFDNLASTTKYNKTLKKMVAGLCVFAVLLIGSVFGATLAAARLTKDTQVDNITGIMYAKQYEGDHSYHTTMKTGDAIFYSDSTTQIMDMSNNQLTSLKEILLGSGDVKFQIKGYARAKDNTYINLLVEGGTIIYDINGLASATGDAKIILDTAYGEQQQGEDGENRRYVASSSASCSSSSSSSSSATSSNSCGNAVIGSGLTE